MPAVSYDQAVQNLNTGGLQGAELAQAQDVLKGAYAVPSQTNGPTVLTNTGIIEDKIPKLTSRLADLVPPQQTQSTPEEQATDPITAFYQNQDDSGDAFSAENDLIGGLQESSDLATNAYINAIKSTFQADKQQLEQSQRSNQASTKNALLRSGASRYAPTVAHSLLSAENRADLQTLGKLQSDENLQIAQAMQAKQQNDYRVLEKRLNSIDSLRKQKQDIAKTVYDTLTKRKEQNSKDVNDVLTDAAKNGAPGDVLEAIRSSGNIAGALTAAGDYMQSGEYADYRRAAMAAGQTPIDPNTYYQKKWNYANGGSSSLGGAPFDEGNVPFQSTIESAASFEGSVAGQKAALKQLGDLAQNGDYPSLLNRMESMARKGMGATAGGEVFTAQNQIKALDNMSKVLQQYQAAGGDMNYLKGSADTVAKRIGTLATDPRFASIATQLTAAFQQYRQNMTGAAFGANENAEYKSVFPSADKSFQLNAAVMDGLKNYYSQNVNNAYETQLGEGYTNLKDYVDRGLTPSGKYFIDSQEKATSLIQDLGAQDPHIQEQTMQFLREYPDASATDVLNFLGVPISEQQNDTVSTSGNRPQRNNNPLNIKASEFTINYPGVKGKDPVPATDGGQFLVFATPEAGLGAAKKLITGESYRNLTVDQALKRWSGKGYGAEIAPEFSGLRIKDLTPVQVDSLVKKMATREGYYA